MSLVPGENLLELPGPLMDLSALTRSQIVVKPHQWQTRDFLLANFHNYNLSEMGTGKTLGEVLALRELYLHDAVRRILVIAPLSVLGCVWEPHLRDFAPEVPRLILNNASKRGKLMGAAGNGVVVINPDGVVSLASEIHAWKPQLIVIDEIAGYYRNMRGTAKKIAGRKQASQNQRWAALAGIIHAGKNPVPCWPMTGTPTPKGLMDVYAQVMLVTPWRLPLGRNRQPIRFTALREMLHYQPYPNVWAPKPGAMERVMDMMQPAIRFTRRQVMAELPEALQQRRKVELTKDQARMIEELKANAKTAYGETIIKGVNASALATKITQIACGAVYGQDREIARPSAGPRVAEVCDILEQAGAPVILAVPYIHVAHMLVEMFRERKLRAECILGETRPDERTRLVQSFQSGEIDVLVMHPKTAAHGLTLTRAHTVVWYAPFDDAELYEQLNARITRYGQTEQPCVVELYATPAERIVHDRNRGKCALQGTFLEFFEGD